MEVGKRGVGGREGEGVLWGVFNGCCNWFQPKLGL